MKFDPTSKNPIEKSKRRHDLKVIDRKWSAATNALKAKQGGGRTNAEKALKHHQVLADKEKEDRPESTKRFEREHGTFEERFKRDHPVIKKIDYNKYK